MELLRLLDTSQLELLPAQVPVALDSESSSEDEDVDSTESMTRQMQIQLASYCLNYFQKEELSQLNNFRALERARIEAQITHWEDAMYGKGALVGDNYESLPDEADELAYDALEKAYNAAFQVCDPEKLKRSQRQQKRLYFMKKCSLNEMEKRRTLLGNRKETFESKLIASLAENFDNLLRRRDQVLEVILEKEAQEDVAAYKKYILTKRKRSLAQLRRRRFQDFTIEGNPEFQRMTISERLAFYWKNYIISPANEEDGIGQRGSEWRETRKEQFQKLSQLAKECKTIVSEKPMNARVDETGSGSLTSTPPPNVAFSPENVKLLAKEKNRLHENFSDVVEFLLLEAEKLFQMIVDNAIDPAEMQHAITELTPEISAGLSAFQLFRYHAKAIAQFDADWNRCFKLSQVYDKSESEVLPVSIDEEKQKELASKLKNPFATGQVEKWSRLNQNEASDPSVSGNLFVQGIEKVEKLIELKEKLPTSAEASYAKLSEFRNIGANSILIGKDETFHFRHQLIAHMIDLGQKKDIWGVYLVVAPTNLIPEWNAAFERYCPDLRVLPYWGDADDTATMRSFWQEKNLYTKGSLFHVVLTTYQVLHDNLTYFQRLHWQLMIVDSPLAIMTHSDCMPYWTKILSLQCRQRTLMTDTLQTKKDSKTVDLRLLLHFILPALFSSTEKVVAWASAGLNQTQLERLVNVVENFCIGDSCLRDTLTAMVVRCQDESEALRRIEEVNAQTAIAIDHAAVVQESIQPVVQEGVRTRHACQLCDKTFLKTTMLEKHSHNEHAPLGTHMCVHCDAECYTAAVRRNHEKIHERQGSEVKQPKRASSFRCFEEASVPMETAASTPPPIKSESGRKKKAPKARKRITRCGRCAGCVSGDCMKCGHCRDMKKYGGPGLRKQSCKNRKCINPQIVILNTSKEERYAGAAGTGHAMSSNISPENLAAMEELDMEYDRKMQVDGDEGDYYGSESDLEKTGASSSTTVPIPRVPMARTRVMRCGTCVGCNAADCKACRHCKDMKKYGGPGLRKQSCKSRKCISPKVVMLNQPKDDDEMDSDDEGYDVNEPTHAPPLGLDWKLEQRLLRGSARVHQHEQLRDLQRLLPIRCQRCRARFITDKQLSIHTAYFHTDLKQELDLNPLVDETGDPKLCRSLSAFDCQTSRIFRQADHSFHDPVVQYAILGGIQRQINQSFSPVGYAKLQGPGLVHFMLRPRLILGRLSSKWRDIYERNGIEIVPGLPGGEIDCHIGDDTTVAHRHAMIAWNRSIKAFEISCLSWLSTISVNGREVSYNSTPVVLGSQNIVQIGARYFFFLLPKYSTRWDSSKTRLADSCNAIRVVPRAEIKAWAKARVKRQRAQDYMTTRLNTEMATTLLKRKRETGDIFE